MVEHEDTHGLASLSHQFRQAVVVATWAMVVAGMVVANGNYSGIGKQGFFQYDAHIDRRFADAAMGETHCLEEIEILIHEQCPCLFHIKVLHLGVHVLIDRLCRIELRTHFCLFHLAALAQFACRHNGDSLGRPHTFVLHELGNAALAQRVEVVVTVVEHPFHQIDGTLFRGARTDENGHELGIAQCFGAQSHEFFTRSVVFCPLGDAEFVHTDATRQSKFIDRNSSRKP